ncbi:MAG: hypothetical protein WB297_04015, partial [Actinomycetota bacterium]
CEQREAVASSFQAVLNTGFLGADGVRQEFVEQFDAFEALFQDFAEAAGQDFVHEAAAAQTAVEDFSSGLASFQDTTDQTNLDISALYAYMGRSVDSLMTAVDAACPPASGAGTTQDTKNVLVTRRFPRLSPPLTGKIALKDGDRVNAVWLTRDGCSINVSVVVNGDEEVFSANVATPGGRRHRRSIVTVFIDSVASGAREGKLNC